MPLFLDKPWPGIILVLALAFCDYPLTAISRSLYYKYMFKFIDYESIGKQNKRFPKFWGIVSKLVLAVLLWAIWAIHSYGRSPVAGTLYLWLLGFAIGTYFIIDLRHIESILLARLYAQTENISGKIVYQSAISIKISAIHFFSFFLIFTAFLFYRPDYLILGLVCAPLFLVIRNLLLS